MDFLCLLEIMNYYNIFMDYIKAASLGVIQLVLKLQ